MRYVEIYYKKFFHRIKETGVYEISSILETEKSGFMSCLKAMVGKQRGVVHVLSEWYR